MSRFIMSILATALLTLPQVAYAQMGGGGGMMAGMQAPNPIEAILLRADSLQLALTADQTSRLTVLRTELDEANAPHQEALTRLMGSMSGGPDPARIQELQTHAQAMRDENAAALERARTEVFSEGQWATVDAFVRTLQPAGRGMGPGGMGGGMRGGMGPGGGGTP